MIPVGFSVGAYAGTSRSPVIFRGGLQRHLDVPKPFPPSSSDNSRGCPRESHQPTPTIRRPHLVVDCRVQCERVSDLHVLKPLTGSCQRGDPNSLGQSQGTHRIGSGSEQVMDDLIGFPHSTRAQGRY